MYMFNLLTFTISIKAKKWKNFFQTNDLYDLNLLAKLNIKQLINKCLILTINPSIYFNINH